MAGKKRSRALIYSGCHISAKEAEDYRIINMVAPNDKLKEEVNNYAAGISINPRDALVLTKDSIMSAMEAMGAGEAFRFSNEMVGMNLQRGLAPDEFNFYETRNKEGLKAAIAKRDEPFKELKL